MLVDSASLSPRQPQPTIMPQSSGLLNILEEWQMPDEGVDPSIPDLFDPSLPRGLSAMNDLGCSSTKTVPPRCGHLKGEGADLKDRSIP
jgi:hypothetical protein